MIDRRNTLEDVKTVALYNEENDWFYPGPFECEVIILIMQLF